MKHSAPVTDLGAETSKRYCRAKPQRPSESRSRTNRVWVSTLRLAVLKPVEVIASIVELNWPSFAASDVPRPFPGSTSMKYSAAVMVMLPVIRKCKARVKLQSPLESRMRRCKTCGPTFSPATLMPLASMSSRASSNAASLAARGRPLPSPGSESKKYSAPAIVGTTARAVDGRPRPSNPAKSARNRGRIIAPAPSIGRGISGHSHLPSGL